jgi:hypothetical protein
MSVMTRRRKLLVGCLMPPLVLLAGAATFLWLACRDDPPPDDADLLLAREDIPDTENAFTCFELAGKAVRWPTRGETEKALGKVIAGTAWNADLVRQTNEANKEALEWWKEGMARPRFQVPEMYSVNQKLPYAWAWLNLANAVSLRSLDLFRQGRETEAMDMAVTLAEFGRRVQEAKGCVIIFVVGCTLMETGLDRVHQLAWEGSLPPEKLNAYAARLARLDSDGKVVADALRGEYHVFCMTAEQIKDGRMTASGFTTFMNGRRYGDASKTQEAVWAVAAASPYHLKVNQTKRLFAEGFRRRIAETPKTLVDAQPRLLEIKRVERAGRPALESVPFHENGSGQCLFLMLMPFTENLQGLQCIQRSNLAATRITLAVKGFEKARGHLPDKLVELVPEFLGAVPADPFDGKPMRWSKERKIVWAIGRDLVDGGGDETLDKMEEAKDLVYHLDPKDAKKPADAETP